MRRLGQGRTVGLLTSFDLDPASPDCHTVSTVVWSVMISYVPPSHSADGVISRTFLIDTWVVRPSGLA